MRDFVDQGRCTLWMPMSVHTSVHIRRYTCISSSTYLSICPYLPSWGRVLNVRRHFAGNRPEPRKAEGQTGQTHQEASLKLLIAIRRYRAG